MGLASISSLAVLDPRVAVQVLGLVQEILPSVAALNNIETSSLTGSPDEEERAHQKTTLCAVKSDDCETPVHYAWAESPHPYKPADVSNYTVSFPKSVDWISLQFDPRCSTAQPEDTLQIFIRNPSHKPIADSAMDHHQKYTPVLSKFSGSKGYPKHSVILPGNEVLFSLETASDYVKDGGGNKDLQSKDKSKSFGFKCLVVGYERRQGMESGMAGLVTNSTFSSMLFV